MMTMNVDSSWGIMLEQIFKQILFCWNSVVSNVNNGAFTSFPSFWSFFFQYWMYIFFGGVSNFFVIIALLFLNCFVFCQIIKLVFGKILNLSFLTIFVMAIFLISNNHFFYFITYNTNFIWMVFFLLLSIYLLLKYIKTSEIKYLLCLSFLQSIAFMEIFNVMVFFLYLATFLLFSRQKTLRQIKDLFCYFFVPFLMLNFYSFSLLFTDKKVINFNSNTSKIANEAVVSYFNQYTTLFDNLIFNQTFEKFGNVSRSFFWLDIFLIIIALLSLFFVRKEKNKDIKNFVLINILQYIFFNALSSGDHYPIKIFDFFYFYVPGFSLFRDFSKFNRLAVINILILFIYSLIKIKQYFKSTVLKNLFLGIIGFFFIFRALIYYSVFYDYYKPSTIPDYYFNFYQFSLERRDDTSCLILPTIGWQQKFDWHQATELLADPLTYFSSKNILISPISHVVDFNAFVNQNLSQFVRDNDMVSFIKLLNLKNSNCVIVRKDLISEYDQYLEKETTYSLSPDSMVKNLENENFKEIKNLDSKLIVFDLAETKKSLAHFYTPKTIILVNENVSTLPKIIAQDKSDSKLAIYFSDNNFTGFLNNFIAQFDQTGFNEETKISLMSRGLRVETKTIANSPNIEFKKINSTKYRVIIHQAKDNFPLIFSESFHNGWRIYNMQVENKKLKVESWDRYKILDGNEDNQASLNELKNYINSGYISTLGDLKSKNIKHVKWENNKKVFDYNEPYKIDFISKDFNGTIQNDNLEKGNFYETWLQKPISDNKNHKIVNGYANSWDIKPNDICFDNDKCIKNADGSYDLELVIEFWPQRIFFLGLFISIITVFSGIVFLIYDFIKKHKLKNKLK